MTRLTPSTAIMQSLAIVLFVFAGLALVGAASLMWEMQAFAPITLLPAAVLLALGFVFRSMPDQALFLDGDCLIIQRDAVSVRLHLWEVLSVEQESRPVQV